MATHWECPNCSVEVPGPYNDQGMRLLAASVSCCTVASSLVVGRWIFRIKEGSRKGPDDYLVTVAAVLELVMMILVIVAVQNGFGSDRFGLERESMASTAFKIAYVQTILYELIMTFVRLSILFLYLRILPVTQARYRLVAKITAIVVLAHGIAMIVADVFKCSPPTAPWNFVQPPNCVSRIVLDRTSSITAFVLDTVIWLIPMPVLGRLNMPLWKRAMLMAGFLIFGVVATVALGFRLNGVLSAAYRDGDPVQGAKIVKWMAVESCWAIIAACSPLFVNIGIALKNWFRKRMGKPTATVDPPTTGSGGSEAYILPDYPKRKSQFPSMLTVATATEEQSANDLTPSPPIPKVAQVLHGRQTDPPTDPKDNENHSSTTDPYSWLNYNVFITQPASSTSRDTSYSTITATTDVERGDSGSPTKLIPSKLPQSHELPKHKRNSITDRLFTRLPNEVSLKSMFSQRSSVTSQKSANSDWQTVYTEGENSDWQTIRSKPSNKELRDEDRDSVADREWAAIQNAGMPGVIQVADSKATVMHAPEENEVMGQMPSMHSVKTINTGKESAWSDVEDETEQGHEFAMMPHAM